MVNDPHIFQMSLKMKAFLVFILYKGGQLTPFSKGKGKPLKFFIGATQIRSYE